MYSPLAFFQGAFVPQAELHIPHYDAGFVLGATVTDLCRTVHHRLYRWPDHLARFRRSCDAASIHPELSDAEISECAGELVARNAERLAPDADLALVLLATPGAIGYYLGEDSAAGEAGATFIMHTFPLPFARYRRYFERGISLVTPGVRNVPAVCVDPHIKQRSRMHWWLADREVHRIDPGAQALLLDLEGHVTETAAANFLVVTGGTVVSPPRQTVLEGVSLQVVRELCAALSIRFDERPLRLEECLQADEALLTSTPYCLAGVSSINGKPLPWPGPVFSRLLAAWSEHVGLDIPAQITGSSQSD
jgi:branched-subunit amino acid aminotransferase/4-amino-4-deoxychorismate lyase